eukprot:gene11087-23182_t
MAACPLHLHPIKYSALNTTENLEYEPEPATATPTYSTTASITTGISCTLPASTVVVVPKIATTVTAVKSALVRLVKNLPLDINILFREAMDDMLSAGAVQPIACCGCTDGSGFVIV